MENSKMFRRIWSFIITVLISVSLVMPQYYVFAVEEVDETAYSGSRQAELALGSESEDAEAVIDSDIEDAEQVLESISQEAKLSSDSAPGEMQSFTTSVKEVRRGSVILELSGEEFKNAGYQAGDIVSVRIGSAEALTVPFIEGHSGVGFHKSALSLSSYDNSLTLRTSEGNFAETYGITDNQAYPEITIGMEEPGGYLYEYNALQIGMMSNDRNDFPDLTDEEFANYRCVTTTGIKKGVLYRTSSPINPMIKRNKIADEANRKNKVTTIINLSETPESAAGREGYNESYYVTVNHHEANMSTDFGSDTFNSKLATALRFMIANPGIFEVNCIFGKDRTGFMIAVLEGLAGATYDELVNDYAATYSHYYPEYNNYNPVSERDRIIAESNLIAQMEYAYDVDDLKTADIKSATMGYLSKIGLTDDEIEALRSCLVCSIEDTSVGSVTYNGQVQGPVITYEGKILEENKDYTWEKTDSSLSYTDAGKYSVTLTGIGLFAGSKTVQYDILPVTVTPEVKLSQDTYTYNGEERKPAITVSVGEKVLNESGYTVIYDSGRKNVGTYKVTVNLKGNYSGSSTADFRINPKGTSIKKPKPGKKSIKVKWKKQSAKNSKARISGYQIQVATDSKFTKNKKTVKVKGSKKTSKWVKKLKGGRNYYVRVRTYKTVGKKKYYSTWSKAINATTKK